MERLIICKKITTLSTFFTTLGELLKQEDINISQEDIDLTAQLSSIGISTDEFMSRLRESMKKRKILLP